MRASFKLLDTGKVEATLAVTMPLGTWRELADGLPQSWPHWAFARQIREMIYKAERQYTTASGEVE